MTTSPVELTYEIEQQICEDFTNQKFATMTALAESWGITLSRLTRVLKAHGVYQQTRRSPGSPKPSGPKDRRRCRLTREKEHRMLVDYYRGMSYEDLGDKYNVGRGRINRVVHKYHLRSRKSLRRAGIGPRAYLAEQIQAEVILPPSQAGSNGTPEISQKPPEVGPSALAPEQGVANTPEPTKCAASSSGASDEEQLGEFKLVCLNLIEDLRTGATSWQPSCRN